MMNKAKRYGFLEGVPDIKGGVPISRSGNQSKFHHGGPYVVHAYAKSVCMRKSVLFIYGLLISEGYDTLHRYFCLTHSLPRCEPVIHTYVTRGNERVNEESLNLVVMRRILANHFVLAHLTR